MNKKLKIRDLTLRDGQQSLFATRMNQAQIDRVLPYFKEANFYAMEVWGGAVPDSIMRYLNENPWDRLKKIKKTLGDSTKLTALSRGRNLFGYNPYPEEVMEGFIRNSISNGIDILRVFDCLNDIENLKSSIEYIHQNKGIADCAISYTVDPKFSLKQKYHFLIHGKAIPDKTFTLNYYVRLAKELENLGADMITIKDMAGLITPRKTGELVDALKKNVKVPIDFHTHCTPGYGLASMLMAIIHGADVIDTTIMSFAGGPAAPAIELIYLFCQKLGIEIDVNMEAVVKIDKELRKIRKELATYDTTQRFPRQFDVTKDHLPAKIEILFSEAIEYAQKNNEVELLTTIHEIEAWFNFDPADEAVRRAEIPGGMYTNMYAQLKQLKLEHLLPKVLEMVPEVRIDAGCPPLVTPTSQIIGAQAVNCVIALSEGKEKYSNVSTQFHNLIKGWYGKTPVAIDPEFRFKLCGHREPQPFDLASYKKPENSMVACENYCRQLAENEEEMLLLELFPSVASTFLHHKKEAEIMAIIQEIENKRRQELEEKRKQYENLTPEQKRKRLEKGLSAFYDWGSIDDHPDIRAFEEELYRRNRPDFQE